MDGVHVGDLGGADDAVDLEVAVRAGGAADANGLVGELDVQAFDIRFRVDGNRLDADFAAGAHDAQSDLATVGDENFIEHEARGYEPPAAQACRRNSGWPKLDRLAVFAQNLGDDARDLGLDLVHDLHRFDECRRRFRPR